LSVEVSDLEGTWLTHNLSFQQKQSTNPFQEVFSVDVKLFYFGDRESLYFLTKAILNENII